MSPAVPGVSPLYFHDAAAALVVDGQVVFAAEEERATRIKHINQLPMHSLTLALEYSGIKANDIDCVAYPFEEAFCDAQLRRLSADLRVPVPLHFRTLVIKALEEGVGLSNADKKLKFVRHHDAHAAAAFIGSGFEEALVVVIDGMGEDEAISIHHATANGLLRLADHSAESSLGFYYHRVTGLLGFGVFDEYKVMGLAPYGDPSAYREAFLRLYTPYSDAGFFLDVKGLTYAASTLGVPARGRNGPLMQAHKDFAAAAQELLERICLDIVRHWQKITGLSSLCLVGGVAQNCAMNGVVARSNLFKSLYVHPAAHDGGVALGAALRVGGQFDRPNEQFFSPFVGRRLAQDDQASCEAAIEPWSAILTWEQPTDLLEDTAKALAAGAIVGWARGRAEFGPRALGARSILADPRPSSNRDRINRAVKKREDFRPFAPAVLDQEAVRYFELPQARCNLGEMAFVVPVRPSWRTVLGAVTHVDGTARVQVVDRDVNPDFWRLVRAFGKLTGVSVLLNTSFNNSYEPIVDSADDAVRTFLLTDLDMLVLGPYVVRKTAGVSTILASSTARLEAGATVTCVYSGSPTATAERGGISIPLSWDIADWLIGGGGAVRSMLASRSTKASAALVHEMARLWEARLLDVTMPALEF
jgi:carbamoyltransferase